ncbi:GNAT family N-acetyltransferase [Carboxylicivirga sp. RSCT41]|uniref:GNAT family N-acetyltransferase n=1 Tax=Carboxylicivirga agarovorans TaxID=3417570 RepID=UPI003D32D97E
MKLSYYRLGNANDDLFPAFWKLYENAFPLMERRDLVLQKKVLTQEIYHCDVILNDQECVGIILWWQFNNAVYIEHLAIEDKWRGQGLGAQVLNDFMNGNEQRIILEVELPDKTINKRRITFYQRIGFKLNNYKHKQWPLRRNGEELDLLLMSFPNLLTSSEFKEFQIELKERCFLSFQDYIV